MSPEEIKQLTAMWLVMIAVSIFVATLMCLEGWWNIQLARQLGKNGAWRRSSVTTIRRHSLRIGQAAAMLSIVTTPQLLIYALVLWGYLFMLNGVFDYIDWRRLLRVVRPIPFEPSPSRRQSDE